jgi:hypothetical protein
VFLQIPIEVLMRAKGEKAYPSAFFDLVTDQVKLLLVGELVDSDTGKGSLF